MKGAIVLTCLAALAAAHPADYKPTTTSCTETICADYINSCGLWYGGCFPACPGYTTPSFSVPPCPSTTKPCKTTTNTKKLPTTTRRIPTIRTTAAPCRTICVDAINECGIRYGGCYCHTLTPPYTKPPCPSTTTTPPVTYPTVAPGPTYCGGLRGLQCPKGQTCIDDPRSPCGIAVDCLGICIVEEFCGGFGGFPCKSKTDVCIDDPRDDCDPKNGGADCGGLCVPKRWT